MIEHIVSFKMKNIEELDVVDNKFAKLVPVIDTIVSYKFEKNIYLKRESNFDGILKIYFKSEADLETYLFDERHVAFASEMREKYWQNAITIDTLQ